MRSRNVNGVIIPFTDAENAEADDRDVLHATKVEADKLTQYQRDRDYGSVGDQLDMIYKDQINGTTTFKDHVAAVKLAHPKP